MHQTDWRRTPANQLEQKPREPGLGSDHKLSLQFYPKEVGLKQSFSCSRTQFLCLIGASGWIPNPLVFN